MILHFNPASRFVAGAAGGRLCCCWRALALNGLRPKAGRRSRRKFAVVKRPDVADSHARQAPRTAQPAAANDASDQAKVLQLQLDARQGGAANVCGAGLSRAKQLADQKVASAGRG